MINEYGTSSESIEEFAKRNKFVASPKFPQNLKTKSEVNFNSSIPFLPIMGFENEDWNKMYQEADSLEAHYVPHRHHESHRGWSSLVIHGLSSVHTGPTSYYGYDSDNAPYKWTDISEWCPTITKFFKSTFDYTKYRRLRIMKLAPGGYIWPHRDHLIESTSHIGPTNIALNNPDNCHFYMDDIGILPFSQGSIIKLNLYNVHAVYNQSKENRYHIIVHGTQGNSWKNRIYDSYLHWKEIYS